nr:hypothetical protein CFP56_77049 [Quercus suber]
MSLGDRVSSVPLQGETRNEGHHVLPSSFCALDVVPAIERDIRECVAVDKLHSPVQETDDASEDAERDARGHITGVGFMLSGDRAGLAEHVDDGHQQTTQADGTEAVRQSAASSTSRWPFGWVAWGKVPCAVHARDGDVDDILENLGDPVAGERDEDDQSDDRRRATAS